MITSIFFEETAESCRVILSLAELDWYLVRLLIVEGHGHEFVRKRELVLLPLGLL